MAKRTVKKSFGSKNALESKSPRPKQTEPGFARPGNLADGRIDQEWESRYKNWRCISQMWCEAVYLFLLLVIAGAALVLVWEGTPQDWLGVDDGKYLTFKTHAYAWIAGVLGGTLLSVKWLYHSIGKGRWHVDRLAWRFFTPHLSGAFSFCLIALLASGVVNIINQDQLKSPSTIVGLGLLLGYFSDFTVARLYEIAENLLGGRAADRGAPDTGLTQQKKPVGEAIGAESSP